MSALGLIGCRGFDPNVHSFSHPNRDLLTISVTVRFFSLLQVSKKQAQTSKVDISVGKTDPTAIDPNRALVGPTTLDLDRSLWDRVSRLRYRLSKFVPVF